MAKTRDYMDYLDNEISIAPANSQEEFQAAETIVDVMRDHGLEPTIQEFDAHPWSRMLPSILMIMMFAGMLLSGVGSGLVRGVGFVLVAVPAVILVLGHFGNNLLQNVGPASKSQNVIGVHRASGDQVTKGSRPIVILAHYDTPHESPLYERLAQYQSLLKRASVPCLGIVLVAALVQVCLFLPGGLRVVVWILGLVAALPLVVLAVCNLIERFSPCTVGANDNKSSIAAMLSLLDEVHPGDDRVPDAGVTREERAYDGDEEADETSWPNERPRVYGVRHGKEVLEQLGILPDTCEIEYEVESETPVQPEQETARPQSEDVPVAEEQTWEDSGEEASKGSESASEIEAPEVEDNELFPTDDSEGGAWENDEPVEYQEDYETGDVQPEEGYDDWYEGGTEYDPASEPSYDQTDAWEDDVEISSDTDGGETLPSKIKGIFGSLKERIASRKSGASIDIPRGDRDGSGDFAEFEETDWGEDEWSDDQYLQQGELKSINREELIARRSGSQHKSAGEEESQYNTDDEVIDDSPQENEQDSEELQEEGAEDVTSRTTHDISHEDGPDWAVVETDEEQEPVDNQEQVPFDQRLYGRGDDDEPQDDLFADEDLVDVEDELEEDQLVSAPVRPVAKRASAYQENASASGEDDAGEVDSALNWDDNSAADGEEEKVDGDDILPKDTRGLDAMSDDYADYEPDGTPEDELLDEPEPVDDPTWGQTSYVPPKPKSNIARRATLYDVPNPSDESLDPLDVDDEEQLEDQEADEKRARDWKGGAAPRSDLRDDAQIEDPEWLEPNDTDDTPSEDEDAAAVDQDGDYDDGDVIHEDELQDSILRMGDDLLIAHDIWFVAVGASEVDHAGVRAFLSNFRNDIRGAFLINLDCVGAGTPSVLTREGLHEGRRSDRRLARLISDVADDLHVDLGKASYDWDETDATAAMRARVRSVTIMGLDDNGQRALSHTQEDVPENVNPRQVAGIVRVLAEVIRRS